MPDWSEHVVQRLASLSLRPGREAEIIEELSQHLDQRYEELRAGGTNDVEARRLALEELLDQDLVDHMRSLRQARHTPPGTPGAPAGRLLAAFPRDLRDAARTLKKQPGFSAVAVLTLALGIGATTAVFSVVYGVLLKPLPFRDTDRLVAVYTVTPASQKDALGAAGYFTYRDHGRVFEDIGLWNAGHVSVIRNGTPVQIQALWVTYGTLSLLGVRPELGRLIGQADDVPGAPLVAVLTHAYWQSAFGSSPDIVGQSLVIDGKPYEIIGVLPASFRLLGTNPQLVLPGQLDRATTMAVGGPGGPSNGIARLNPSVTLAQANEDIARMIPLIPKLFPLMPGVTQAMWDSFGIASNVRPLSEAVIGEMSRPLWILLGSVGLVLLMAWTNVANLLLVRAEGRQREFAIRQALGASRGRIAAALLSETLMLGLTGGALGVLFAQAGIGLLRRVAPVALPRLSDIGIDTVVLLVTLATAVVTSLLFGLLPVLRHRMFNVEALQEANRSSTDSPERHRTRNLLVVVQVALALVLLIVSGLMARTFVTMERIQPGFVRPAEVQTFDLDLPATLIPDGVRVAQTYEHIAERLQQIPGVTSVGLGWINMTGAAAKAPIYVEGVAPPSLPPIRSIWNIGAGYFETLGDSVVAGRDITWADIQQSRLVALISENLAREYWDPPAKAIGQRISMFPGRPGREIVGVVGDIRADGLNHPAPALVYFPMTNVRFTTYLVRSGLVGTPGFFRELQQAVWSVNPSVPLANVRTLDDVHADSMAQTSFALVMLAIAASVALLLGVVGIYGVIRYIAAQRTGEIGIRMALGAQPWDVRRLFLRRGLVLISAGITVGVGVALIVTRVMSALLFGVTPTDPVTYVAASAALAAIALLATYLPARRASGIDPIVALRSNM